MAGFGLCGQIRSMIDKKTNNLQVAIFCGGVQGGVAADAANVDVRVGRQRLGYLFEAAERGPIFKGSGRDHSKSCLQRVKSLAGYRLLRARLVARRRYNPNGVDTPFGGRYPRVRTRCSRPWALGCNAFGVVDFLGRARICCGRPHAQEPTGVAMKPDDEAIQPGPPPMPSDADKVRPGAPVPPPGDFLCPRCGVKPVPQQDQLCWMCWEEPEKNRVPNDHPMPPAPLVDACATLAGAFVLLVFFSFFFSLGWPGNFLVNIDTPRPGARLVFLWLPQFNQGIA